MRAPQPTWSCSAASSTSPFRCQLEVWWGKCEDRTATRRFARHVKDFFPDKIAFVEEARLSWRRWDSGLNHERKYFTPMQCSNYSKNAKTQFRLFHHTALRGCVDVELAAVMTAARRCSRCAHRMSLQADSKLVLWPHVNSITTWQRLTLTIAVQEKTLPVLSAVGQEVPFIASFKRIERRIETEPDTFNIARRSDKITTREIRQPFFGKVSR